MVHPFEKPLLSQWLFYFFYQARIQNIQSWDLICGPKSCHLRPAEALLKLTLYITEKSDTCVLKSEVSFTNSSPHSVD